MVTLKGQVIISVPLTEIDILRINQEPFPISSSHMSTHIFQNIKL